MISLSGSVTDSVQRLGLASRTDGRTDERTESVPLPISCLASSYARAQVAAETTSTLAQLMPQTVIEVARAGHRGRTIRTGDREDIPYQARRLIYERDTLCGPCNSTRGNRRTDVESARLIPVTDCCLPCSGAGYAEQPNLPTYCGTCGSVSVVPNWDWCL